MRLGYNTNGLANHSLESAICLLDEIGYRSVAITLDHSALDPFDAGVAVQLRRVKRLLSSSGLNSVIETGARYLLDPFRKHEPTLVSPDAMERARRVVFLKRAIDIAAELASDCVSLWSGQRHSGSSSSDAWAWAVEGLQEVVSHAGRAGVPVGFEPEPGMLVSTMSEFQALDARVSGLQLTLDVGHLHCLGETPIDSVIHGWSDRIVNVHIEDMRQGVHEHLMFGDGEIEFGPVLTAFAAANYHGSLHVELSRHSHVGPDAAREAFGFLTDVLQTVTQQPLEA